MMSENSENKEEDKQEYQSVESIELHQVSESEEGFEKATSVTVENESEEEVRKIVQEKLKNQNWWLQEYWQEKGLPKEQVNIEVGDHKISLYNFGEQLQEIHLEQLQKALADVSRIDGSKQLKKVEYILLDDKVQENPNTSEEQRGYAATGDRAIKLYPKGTSLDDYREEETDNFKGVSNFESCIIHELTHDIPTHFQNSWRKKYWKELEKPKENKGGSHSFEEPIEPEKCVSSYATVNSGEDICESMIAALRKPEVLDSEKLQLIKDELLKENESLPVSMDRREGAGVELPRLDTASYKTEKNSFKFKRRIKKEE